MSHRRRGSHGGSAGDALVTRTWSLDLEHPHKILTSVVGRGKGSLKPDGKLEQLGSANSGFIHNT